jgi:hypothetical protein
VAFAADMKPHNKSRRVGAAIYSAVVDRLRRTLLLMMVARCCDAAEHHKVAGVRRKLYLLCDDGGGDADVGVVECWVARHHRE